MNSNFFNGNLSRDALRRKRLMEIEDSKTKAEEVRKAKAKIGEDASIIISGDGNIQPYRKTGEQIKADDFSRLFKRMMKLHRGEIENPVDDNGEPIDKRTALQKTINELKVDHYEQLKMMAPYVQTAGYNIDGLESLFEDKRILRTNIDKSPIDRVSERLYSLLSKLKEKELGKDVHIDEAYLEVASKYPNAMKWILKNPNIRNFSNNAELNKLATGGIFAYSAVFKKRVEVEGIDSIKDQVYSALDQFLKNEEMKFLKPKVVKNDSEKQESNVKKIKSTRNKTSKKVKKVVNA